MKIEVEICDFCKKVIAEVKCEICDKNFCLGCCSERGITFCDTYLSKIKVCKSCQERILKAYRKTGYNSSLFDNKNKAYIISKLKGIFIVNELAK